MIVDVTMWYIVGIAFVSGFTGGTVSMAYYYEREYQPMLGFISGVRQEAERKRRHEKK